MALTRSIQLARHDRSSHAHPGFTSHRLTTFTNPHPQAFSISTFSGCQASFFQYMHIPVMCLSPTLIYLSPIASAYRWGPSLLFPSDARPIPAFFLITKPKVTYALIDKAVPWKKMVLNLGVALRTMRNIQFTPRVRYNATHPPDQLLSSHTPLGHPLAGHALLYLPTI